MEMFKFELGQMVYYVRDNKLHTAKIVKRNYADQEKASSLAGFEKTVSYGLSDKNCSVFYESQLFAHLEQLLAHLKNTIVEY
jgi:glycyl-tRNA synthetase beta subunit